MRGTLHHNLVLLAKPINSLAKKLSRRLPFPFLSLCRKVDIEFGTDVKNPGKEVPSVDDASQWATRTKSLQKLLLNWDPELIGWFAPSLNAEQALASRREAVFLRKESGLSDRRQLKSFFYVLPLLWSSCAR